MNFTFVFLLLNQFEGQSAKLVNRSTPPSFDTLAFHNGLKDYNADLRTLNGDDPAAFYKTLCGFPSIVFQDYGVRVLLGENWHIQSIRLSQNVLDRSSPNFRIVRQPTLLGQLSLSSFRGR